MKHANISVFVPHNGCPHTCAFCNQRIISGESAQPTPGEVSELLRADMARSRLSGTAVRERELAFFGGSFTAIDREYMLSLLEAAQPYIENGYLSGMRCSTRPDCIDEETLDLLGRFNMTSIELGAQSMDDRVLSLNSRGHTAAQVEKAARMIKQRGFGLGLQMMTGLYGDSDEGAFETARRLAELSPATVRIYPTVVLAGTRLAELCEKGEYEPQTLEGAVELCSSLLDFFEKRGIKVIKLGLHASRDVERDYVAGAYHPAMRELCESRLYLKKLLELLCAAKARKASAAVNPRELSKALGQKRENIKILAEKGFAVDIVADESVPAGDIDITCDNGSAIRC